MGGTYYKNKIGLKIRARSVVEIAQDKLSVNVVRGKADKLGSRGLIKGSFLHLRLLLALYLFQHFLWLLALHDVGPTSSHDHTQPLLS